MSISFLVSCKSTNTGIEETLIYQEQLLGGSDGNNETVENLEDENLEVENSEEESESVEMTKLRIEANGVELITELEKNSSAEALIKALEEGPIHINMRDYGGFEKVGDLGVNLPTKNQQITTRPGDLILYQGSAFVIYYAPISWNFTPLGHIEGATKESLLEVLGQSEVQVTLSLTE